MNSTLQKLPRQANKPFILSDFQDRASSDFKKDPKAYAASLSKKLNKVFMYLFQFRYKEGIVLSNKVIAMITGCNRRTVERATKKFHDDGVILKNKPHTYSMNRYYFHPLLIEGPASFSLWFKTMTPTQKESYWEQGISGIAKSRSKNVVRYIKEYSMAKDLTLEGWCSLPISARIDVSSVSVYGLSKDRNFSNGNDGGGYGLSRPYNDISFGKKSLIGKDFSDETDRNGACKFCWECYKDLSECNMRGGATKKIELQYLH